MVPFLQIYLFVLKVAFIPLEALMGNASLMRMGMR